jgi:hypothetical protein
MIYYLLTPSSLRIDCTRTIFAVAFAMALYSDFVFDLETVGYFFALQAIKLGPKNITNPPIDRLSSMQLA